MRRNATLHVQGKHSSGAGFLFALIVSGCSAPSIHSSDASPSDTISVDAHDVDGKAHGIDTRDDAAQPQDLRQPPPRDLLVALDVPHDLCTRCHGGIAKNAAPPQALHGELDTSDRAVGAHQAHLLTSTWHVAIRCRDCHLVPKELLSKGHIDTALPAEIVFSDAASRKKLAPRWNGITCTNTYCHGATLFGGKTRAPRWTLVDGSQRRCDSCHGFPPTKNHPASPLCHKCHQGMIDDKGKIIDPSRHIDGKITLSGAAMHPPGYAAKTAHGKDFNTKGPGACTICHGATLTGGWTLKSCETCHPGWKTQCNFCHGRKGDTSGAPPETVDGQVSDTLPGVGEHGPHRRQGKSHAPFSCSTCHLVPKDALSPGHVDPAPAEVVFSGSMAGTTYDHKTMTCKNIYCHSSGRSGGPRQDLPWVGTTTCADCHSGGNVSICSTCHDDASDGPTMTLSNPHRRHIMKAKMTCASCHLAVVVGNKTIKDFTKHMDGIIQVSETSWNPTVRTCSPTCHGQKRWQ